MTAESGVGERVYRGLLRIFPPDFRDRYADEMVFDFNQQLRDARAGGRSGEQARAWLLMLGDLIATGTAERLRRNRTVAHSISSAPPAVPSRVLGALGILAGIAYFAAFVVELPGALSPARIILFNLGTIGIVLAVHWRQSRVAPALSLAGAVPAIVANAAYAVMILLSLGMTEPIFGRSFGLVLFWIGLAMWLADGWFGIVTAWLHQVTRIGAVAVAVGAPLAIVGMDRLGLTSSANPTIFGPLSLAGQAVLASGLIVLGIDVALRGRRPNTERPA